MKIFKNKKVEVKEPEFSEEELSDYGKFVEAKKSKETK